MGLDLDNWSGNRNLSTSEQIAEGDTGTVLERLDRLDQRKHTQLTINSEDGYLTVSGGLGSYLCFYTKGDNEAFFNLINPSVDQEDDADEIELVTGGQAGLFPPKIIVDKSIATQALSHYIIHHQMDPSLIWEED